MSLIPGMASLTLGVGSSRMDAARQYAGSGEVAPLGVPAPVVPDPIAPIEGAPALEGMIKRRVFENETLPDLTPDDVDPIYHDRINTWVKKKLDDPENKNSPEKLFHLKATEKYRTDKNRIISRAPILTDLIKIKKGFVYRYDHDNVYKALESITTRGLTKLKEDIEANKSKTKNHKYRWAEYPSRDDLAELSKKHGIKGSHH